MAFDSNDVLRSHVQTWTASIAIGTTMRTALFATVLWMATTSLAQAQSPVPNLPNQGSSPSPVLSPSTPNAGSDEVAARRKLEDAGYRDLRNMTPNADGTFSARGTRSHPPGVRPGSRPEVNVDIDASGNIKER
jgi:hypothetical protein